MNFMKKIMFLLLMGLNVSLIDAFDFKTLFLTTLLVSSQAKDRKSITVMNCYGNSINVVDYLRGTGGKNNPRKYETTVVEAGESKHIDRRSSWFTSDWRQQIYADRMYSPSLAAGYITGRGIDEINEETSSSWVVSSKEYSGFFSPGNKAVWTRNPFGHDGRPLYKDCDEFRASLEPRERDL